MVNQKKSSVQARRTGGALYGNDIRSSQLSHEGCMGRIMTMGQVFWVLFMCFGLAEAVQAQETADDLSDIDTRGVSASQRDYNTRGVALIDQGRLEEATSMFRSALVVGELNITYLNLGRTLARLGRCDEAIRAYEKVSGAPPVSQPSVNEVSRTLERYLAEVRNECSAQIFVICSTSATMIQINAGGVQPCPNRNEEAWAAPVALPIRPGIHKVTGMVGNRSEIEEAVVSAGQAVTVRLDLAQESVVESAISTETMPTLRAEQAERTTLDAAGYVIGASGIVFLGTALIYDTFVLGATWDEFEELAGNDPLALRRVEEKRRFDDLREEVEDDMRLVKTLSGLGSVLAGIGLVLVFLPEDAAPSADLHLRIHSVPEREEMGVDVRGTW
jgi:tetratricopeptide (TPR) repeat protein